MMPTVSRLQCDACGEIVHTFDPPLWCPDEITEALRHALLLCELCQAALRSLLAKMREVSK